MKAPGQTDRFAYEKELLRRGYELIAGMDEAGRGPLAGPVVAAAVILPRSMIAQGLPPELAGLDDSKRLTGRQRERFYGVITNHPAVCCAVAAVDAATIDAINILNATHRAMNDALSQLKPPPEHTLVDGLRVWTLRFPHTAIVKGDSLSHSIAAASVLAKVTRDRLMADYARLYPVYGFAEHKGYGTPGHLAALARHGPCPIHRRSFAPLKPASPELF
jgi:ribonuclease HII